MLGLLSLGIFTHGTQTQYTVEMTFSLTHWPLENLNGILFLSCSCEIVLRLLLQNLTDDKSTLVQVMAVCHHATSHYLSLC